MKIRSEHRAEFDGQTDIALTLYFHIAQLNSNG